MQPEPRAWRRSSPRSARACPVRAATLPVERGAARRSRRRRRPRRPRLPTGPTTSDGLLSARLAGALNGPVNGAAHDDDFADLLAPDSKKPAAAAPSGAPKPVDARSEGKDPLWFLRRPSAGAEGNGAQPPAARALADDGAPAPAPAPAEEVKLSRPEVLRASLPPLFGAEADYSPAPRALPPEAQRAPSGAAPAAIQPAAAPPQAEPKPAERPADGQDAASYAPAAAGRRDRQACRSPRRRQHPRPSRRRRSGSPLPHRPPRPRPTRSRLPRPSPRTEPLPRRRRRR